MIRRFRGGGDARTCAGLSWEMFWCAVPTLTRERVYSQEYSHERSIEHSDDYSQEYSQEHQLEYSQQYSHEYAQEYSQEYSSLKMSILFNNRHIYIYPVNAPSHSNLFLTKILCTYSWMIEWCQILYCNNKLLCSEGNIIPIKLPPLQPVSIIYLMFCLKKNQT